MRHTEVVAAFVEVAAGAADLVPGAEFIGKESRYRDHESDMPIVVRVSDFTVMTAAMVFPTIFLFVVAAMMLFTLLFIVVTAVLFLVVMMTAVVLTALFLIVMMAAVMLALACHYLVKRLITY